MRGYDDKIGTFGRLGDFWYELTSQDTRRTARHLAHSALMTGANFGVDAAAKGLAGGGWSYASNFDLPWAPRDVAVIGPDLQERIVSECSYTNGVKFYVIRRPLEASLHGIGDVLLMFPQDGVEDFVLRTDTCQYILLPVSGETAEAIPAEDLRVKWIVPVPDGCRPAVIAVDARYLTLGIDFTLQKNSLIFREDPHQLFGAGGKIHVLAGWRRQDFTLDYTLQVDHPRPSQRHVAYFYRSAQTASSLQKALAEVAGRIVLEVSQEITQVQRWCDSTIYTLKDGARLEVDYAHEPYQVGDVLQAGDILGGGIRVEGGRQGQAHWYREFNFREGLPSEVVSPFNGLLIPDHPVRFEAYEDTGSKLHVRPHLPGDPVALANYWAWIKSSELSGGFYLNDVLELAAVDDTVELNGLDFFFENGLNEHALIIELDQRYLGSGMVAVLRKFIDREKLHNAVPIILIK